jgi:outer membrane protein assembly factor BamB
LGEKLVEGGSTGLVPAEVPRSMASGSGAKGIEAKNEDPDMVRLTLPQKGMVGETSHLLFVGGRKKRAYGNRFTVLCWNMKEDKKEWESREILLHGKTVGGEGFEVGFEEVFIHEGLALVHGQYDVIALDWRAGRDLDQRGKKEKKWHFRVPLGFEIQTADLFGDVLLLCGRGSTVAISPKTGEIVWDATELGEFYAGPFFRKDVVLTLRKSPAEVSFRKVGSGRLLCRLGLPGLTKNRKHPMYALEGTGGHPAAAEAAEAVPVAFGEGYLALTDGLTYHVVDVDERRIAWSKSATKLDTSMDPAYRMWIDGGNLFVLKPYYAVLENAVFDIASGDMLWRRREGGRKMDAKLKKYAGRDEAGGKAATGLILSSMVFIDGKVYGIKYQMGATSVALVGMDPMTGKEIMQVKSRGYDEPEAYVEPSWSKNCVVVRIQDGNKFQVWQVDVKEKKIVQKLETEGYGRLGEYGDASMTWQGPHLALWTFEKRKFTR